jgi:hypothetical protein
MMKKIFTVAGALAVAATLTATSWADTPPVPFPSATVSQVFVAAATVAADGSTHNIFAPGGTVIFRAYAVDLKTGKPLAAQDVKYFYVTIPNQPNVKLKFNANAPGATPQMAWTGTWNVPSSFATGLVPFKVLVKTKAKHRGQFVQMPVSPAMLTISANPPADPTAPVSSPTTAPSKLDLSLYVDAVAGTRPAAGVAKPIIGCTQRNVYKRGEDVVLRAWGVDLGTGATLSTDNVDSATATITGVAAPITLNYGAHGSTGAKVLFWSAAWIVPADYPLGVTVIHVGFKVGSKSGSLDYPINVIP